MSSTPPFRTISDLLSRSPSYLPSHGRVFHRRCDLLRFPKGVLGIGIFFSAFILFGLVSYVTFLSPHGRLFLGSWGRYGPKPNKSLFTPTPTYDALTLEELRDIVAHTCGFYSRDFDLNLGWNTMRHVIDASLLQAKLLDRTLVIPSFVYARRCEHGDVVCAEYAPMVLLPNATGLRDRGKRPVGNQMGFRVPITVMLDLPRLRTRHPVITVSDYLRLHGLNPESESSSGTWLQELYHSHPNVFEPNKTKTPSVFIIENHLYEPAGTNRVDYIPMAMKERGEWERYSRSRNGESSGRWPEEKSTNISRWLSSAIPKDKAILEWDSVKDALKALKIEPEVDLNDDGTLEDVLNVHGWEVLYTFAAPVMGMDKTIVRPIKQVVPRPSIRGFTEDYYHVDTDVIALRGHSHESRGPGAMRFTEVSSRSRYISMAVLDLKPPQRVLDLADVLAVRMRELNGGRLWMGAHIRHEDWMEKPIKEYYVERVKGHLRKGRLILEGLRNITTYDIEGVEPNLEQITLPPPLENDRFFVATDEPDPNTQQVICGAGGVLLSDLLTMEDRREIDWPLLFSDVCAIVEQHVLVHSAYFYGHISSSFAGWVENMRAAHGVDQQTTLLD